MSLLGPTENFFCSPFFNFSKIATGHNFGHPLDRKQTFFSRVSSYSIVTVRVHICGNNTSNLSTSWDDHLPCFEKRVQRVGAVMVVPGNLAQHLGALLPTGGDVHTLDPVQQRKVPVQRSGRVDIGQQGHALQQGVQQGEVERRSQVRVRDILGKSRKAELSKFFNMCRIKIIIFFSMYFNFQVIKCLSLTYSVVCTRLILYLPVKLLSSVYSPETQDLEIGSLILRYLE